MLSLIGPIASLLLGIGLLVGASGFLGTLVAVRANLEVFPPAVIGAVMSSYFLGFLLGTLRCPTLIRRVGHIRVYATLAAVAAVAASTHGLPVQPVVRGLIACAFLYGGATFTLYPLSLAHANDHAASGEVLETTRGLLMVYGLSAVFGPVTAGTLMGAFGPRSLFLYFAAAQAFVALYGLYRIRQRRSVAAEEREEFVPLARTSQAALEMLPAVEPSASAGR